ncbi:MAG: ATP-binding cassette domain-containing protein [Planctomycetaceae bacterium]|nr:ATP-binding cassette domain-containing protein [Planctomycetaceae bacterium]
MAARIELDSLTKRFGAFTAVAGLSFQAEGGTVLGFLGPNGAGKSTTMKMVTGFLPSTSGRALVCGFDVASDPRSVRERLGYLPEGAPLYPDMTPKSLLEFAGAARGMGRAERVRAAGAAADRVQLGAVLHQRVETLSKGFKRRVGLALAILHDPEVLVLDEPTDGLDPNQKHEVRGLIGELAEDKVIVLSTHILEEVEAICTRVVLIAAGAKRFDGTPEQLAARSPWHGAVRLRVVEGNGADGFEKELGKLDGVRRVERRAVTGAAEYAVFPEAGATSRGPLAVDVERLVRARGMAPLELSVERGRLDDVFRELTASGARS